MKKSTIIIIALLLIATGLSFRSCQDGYEISDGKVYYNLNAWLTDSEAGRINYIDSADVPTFKEISHSNYAVDKKYVYYKQYRIQGADLITFHTITADSAADKYAVYSGKQKLDKSK